MELFASIAGLEALKKPCKVRLYSDSKYLVDAMSLGWVRRWEGNGWWRNKKEKALNADLWKRLLTACEKHRVEFVWVKGHAGHPENERADELSTLLLKHPDLPLDEGYGPNRQQNSCGTPPLFPVTPTITSGREARAGFPYRW